MKGPVIMGMGMVGLALEGHEFRFLVVEVGDLDR